MSARNSDSAQPVPTPTASTGSVSTLTPRQQQLVSAARQQIEADPHFQQLKPPAFLRAEVTPGLDETAHGYLYLRYDVPGSTPQEFWAHVSATASLKWKSGQVSVPLT